MWRSSPVVVAVDVEEMARRAGRRCQGPAARRGGAVFTTCGHSRATFSMIAHALVDLALADDQRRQDAQHVVAGGQAEQPLAAQLGDEIAGRQLGLAADAEQVAGAAQFGEQLGMSGDQRLRACPTAAAPSR